MGTLKGAFKIKYLIALAFVPVDLMEHYYEAILRMPFYITNRAALRPLLDYFERTWLGSHSVADVIEPRIRINWNVFNCVVQERPKTNGAVEGFHSFLSNMVEINTPGPNPFLIGIKANHNLVEIDLRSFTSGGTLTRDSETLAAKNVRLRLLEACNNFDRDSVDYESYLDSIVSTISFRNIHLNTTFDESDTEIHSDGNI